LFSYRLLRREKLLVMTWCVVIANAVKQSAAIYETATSWKIPRRDG